MARLAAVAARVEAIRGLEFHEPVPGRWIDRAGVRAVLEKRFDQSFPIEQAAEGERLLRDLGFWRHPQSMREVLLTHDVEWLAGFYDPTPARILYSVRDPAFDPSFQEETLVHELVHALQDQHAPAFTLENGVDQDGDLVFAFAALREGAAQWVQFTDNWQREKWPMPTPDAARAEAAINLQDSELPSLISWGRMRVYSEGYAFASRLLKLGGTAALNRALSDPPIASREILHPERYLERPRAVPHFASDPSAWAGDCELLAGDVFGELGVAAWLRDHGVEEGHERIAEAWDGDRAWRLRCEAGAATAWILQFANDAAAQALARLEPPQALPDRLERTSRESRILFHFGLPEGAADYLLDQLPITLLGGFDDYLAANPEVHERAAQWTREVAE